MITFRHFILLLLAYVNLYLGFMSIRTHDYIWSVVSVLFGFFMLSSFYKEYVEHHKKKEEEVDDVDGQG